MSGFTDADTGAIKAFFLEGALMVAVYGATAFAIRSTMVSRCCCSKRARSTATPRWSPAEGGV